MSTACRKALTDLCKANAFHNPGLALARYLLHHATDHSAEVVLLNAARASGATEVYRDAFRCWKELAARSGWLVMNAQTAGALAVGLGNESPLEIGLTIHHTYGMPVVPGSAVKGLCRRMAARLLADKKIEQEHFNALFGEQKAAGCFVFYDAWYDPESVGGEPFHRDVVTVHHPAYYRTRGQGESPERKGAWPTDFDDPTPLPFLVVKPQARFLFAVQCPSAEWHGFVAEMLKHALEHGGVGAKTNAGYGRFDKFVPPPEPPPPQAEPTEVTWRGVRVRRNPSPVAFTIDGPSGPVKVEGHRAQVINNSFTPAFRDGLKKNPRFAADVVVVTKGAETVEIKQITPTEEA